MANNYSRHFSGRFALFLSSSFSISNKNSPLDMMPFSLAGVICWLLILFNPSVGTENDDNNRFIIRNYWRLLGQTKPIISSDEGKWKLSKEVASLFSSYPDDLAIIENEIRTQLIDFDFTRGEERERRGGLFNSGYFHTLPNTTVPWIFFEQRQYDNVKGSERQGESERESSSLSQFYSTLSTKSKELSISSYIPSLSPLSIGDYDHIPQDHRYAIYAGKFKVGEQSALLRHYPEDGKQSLAHSTVSYGCLTNFQDPMQRIERCILAHISPSSAPLSSLSIESLESLVVSLSRQCLNAPFRVLSGIYDEEMIDEHLTSDIHGLTDQGLLIFRSTLETVRNCLPFIQLPFPSKLSGLSKLVNEFDYSQKSLSNDQLLDKSTDKIKVISVFARYELSLYDALYSIFHKIKE